MSAFGGMVLTNRGRNLQAKAQSGAQLNFTRFGVGDGDLGSSSIVELNALKNQVKSINVTKLKATIEGKATVGMVLSNQDLVTGFYFREVGLFAQDPDVGEILYCYANAGATADYIPAGGGPDVVEKSFDVIAIVGTAANVTATINSSLVYASAQDLLDHENDEEAHGLAGKISHSLATAVNDFLVASAAGQFVKKTLAEIKTILGLGSAAYKDAGVAGGVALFNDVETHKADDVNHVNYAVTTGSANFYAVTLNPVPTALAEGFSIAVKINADSTAESTLNVNLLGAKPIKKANGTDVTNLKAGGIYTLRYDGINFILQGEGGEYGTAINSDVRITKTLGTEIGIIQGTLDLSLLTPSNLRKDITIDGITGDKLEFGAGDEVSFNKLSAVVTEPLKTVAFPDASISMLDVVRTDTCIYTLYNITSTGVIHVVVYDLLGNLLQNITPAMVVASGYNRLCVYDNGFYISSSTSYYQFDLSGGLIRQVAVTHIQGAIACLHDGTVFVVDRNGNSTDGYNGYVRVYNVSGVLIASSTNTFYADTSTLLGGAKFYMNKAQTKIYLIFKGFLHYYDLATRGLSNINPTHSSVATIYLDDNDNIFAVSNYLVILDPAHNIIKDVAYDYTTTLKYLSYNFCIDNYNNIYHGGASGQDIYKSKVNFTALSTTNPIYSFTSLRAFTFMIGELYYSIDNVNLIILRQYTTLI